MASTCCCHVLTRLRSRPRHPPCTQLPSVLSPTSRWRLHPITKLPSTSKLPTHLHPGLSLKQFGLQHVPAPLLVVCRETRASSKAQA